jgi:hypothetical protein
MLIGAMVCAGGMWHLRRWALFLSWFIAGVIFAVGCLGARFAWSFWLLKEPSLGERVAAVLAPRVSLTVILPVVWLFYFTRQGVKALFE